MPCLVCAAILASASWSGASTLADFEDNTFTGWIVTGTAWTTGGATGVPETALYIESPQGTYFARSGAPNVQSGELDEHATGTVTSPAFTVDAQYLSWQSVGWSGSGPFPDGDASDDSNRFEILDGTQTVVFSHAVAFSDSWQSVSVDLLAAGFQYGDTFYFRGIDGATDGNYSWFAFDDLQAVPEPSSMVMLILGVTMITGYRRRHTGDPV